MRPVVVAAVALAAAASLAQAPATIDYRVVEVHGKLVRLDADGKTRLAVGDAAHSGERLRTGWASRAELEAPVAATHFALAPATTVRLAADVPGVLLEVERGRLRAIFDHLVGSPPPERVVATPAAVLAVRGTEYGVSVDRRGDTTVAVFAGRVAVTARGGSGSQVMVEPGFAVTVRHGHDPGAPYRHRMTAGDWDHGAMPRTMQGMERSHGTGSMGGMGGAGGMDDGGTGGGGMSGSHGSRHGG